MKLMLIIVNKDDEGILSRQLRDNGYYLTKIATAGGFLNQGNVTLLVGVDNDRVDGVLEIVKEYSKKRVVKIPIILPVETMTLQQNYQEITVGGVTVFVLDVCQFRKV